MNTLQNKKRISSLHAIHRGVLVAILCVGVLGTLLALRLYWYSEFISLYSRAETIAASIDVSDILSLKGDASDLASPVYINLKARLQKIRSVNEDVRFVYIFGNKNENVFIYLDSEDPASPDYSPPGDKYPEATIQFEKLFQTGLPFTEGPKEDRWGTWVAGIAPIKDENGKVVAGLGVYIDARMFYTHVLFGTATPALLTFIMFIIVYTGLRVRRKEKEILTSHANTASLLTEYVRLPLTDVLPKIGDIASRENITPDQETVLRGVIKELSTSVEGVDRILETIKKGVHTKHFPKKD
ncbi:MAG: hypothetical protein NUW02_02935 [Candidatus Campbellbacteria bacterium]|nr:hypothetical protein [Candidatus Campbellbacteria bacterium]